MESLETEDKILDDLSLYANESRNEHAVYFQQ